MCFPSGFLTNQLPTNCVYRRNVKKLNFLENSQINNVPVLVVQFLPIYFIGDGDDIVVEFIEQKR